MIVILIVNITTIIVFLININILFGTKVALFFEGIVLLFIIVVYYLDIHYSQIVFSLSSSIVYYLKLPEKIITFITR
jgi:hypothetical protein